MKKTSPRLVEEIKHPALLDYIRKKNPFEKITGFSGKGFKAEIFIDGH